MTGREERARDIALTLYREHGYDEARRIAELNRDTSDTMGGKSLWGMTYNRLYDTHFRPQKTPKKRRISHGQRDLWGG